MENFTEQEICTHLKNNPDMMYVTPDGHMLYVYVPARGEVLHITTEQNLHEYDSEKVNAFLQEMLRKMMS